MSGGAAVDVPPPEGSGSIAARGSRAGGTMVEYVSAGDAGVGVDTGELGIDVEAIPDAELLCGCREGRAESWDLLTHRYERLIYGIAIHSGLQPADAADVVQTTFVALLKADGLRDSERVGPWLATVARRASWQVSTRQSRETSTAQAQALDLAAGPPPWEDAMVLHDALLRLDEPCRSLLIALYFDPDRPSYQQIAERLDRSPGGIGPLRGRCLERMRILLSPIEERTS